MRFVVLRTRVIRHVGGPRRALVAAVLAATTGLLLLSGSCVAVARLDARFRNPDGIPIRHPDGEPVIGASFELFTSRSPDGAFLTVMRRPLDASAEDLMLLVVDSAGATVGRLAGADAGGRLDDLGWRDASTLWVSVVEFPGRCVGARVASAPAWDFAPDDCSRRPADAGTTRPERCAPSPDGVLRASARYDRTAGFDFGDAARPIPDVRIEDADGRFLAQLGGLNLVGWTVDGRLIVVSDSDHRPYAISRAEIDRIVGDP